MIPFLIALAIIARLRANNDPDGSSLAVPASSITPGQLLGDVLTFIPECYSKNLNCSHPPPISKKQISYYLSNRNLTQKYNLLNENNLNLMGLDKKTVMFLPAYLCNVTNEAAQELVSRYLQRYDCNVITVEYTSLTTTTINKAICDSFGGSEIIAKFLCKLTRYGLNFDLLHLIGFSIGAQYAGLIGGYTQQICNKKVDRITGLDPAGCAYQNFDPSKRLDKSDANFVDVIHTSMGILGYYGTCGHVDFFPNCGTFQHGCPFLGEKSVLANSPIVCDHFRSIYYFLESVNQPNPPFRSTSCEMCGVEKFSGLSCQPDTFNQKYADMGEDCPRNPGASRFYLKTNVFYPYAQG